MKDPIRFDAMRRDISRRLAISTEAEVQLVDRLLLKIELARGTEPRPPLFNTDEGSDVERAYRRGWNQAMQCETTQSMLWRTASLVDDVANEVHQENRKAGLLDLRLRSELVKERG
jgi:hypothetical protein